MPEPAMVGCGLFPNFHDGRVFVVVESSHKDADKAGPKWSGAPVVPQPRPSCLVAKDACATGLLSCTVQYYCPSINESRAARTNTHAIPYVCLR
jgi:hypothetical protein